MTYSTVCPSFNQGLFIILQGCSWHLLLSGISNNKPGWCWMFWKMFWLPLCYIVMRWLWCSLFTVCVHIFGKASFGRKNYCYEHFNNLFHQWSHRQVQTVFFLSPPTSRDNAITLLTFSHWALILKRFVHVRGGSMCVFQSEVSSPPKVGAFPPPRRAVMHRTQVHSSWVSLGLSSRLLQTNFF